MKMLISEVESVFQPDRVRCEKHYYARYFWPMLFYVVVKLIKIGCILSEFKDEQCNIPWIFLCFHYNYQQNLQVVYDDTMVNLLSPKNHTEDHRGYTRFWHFLLRAIISLIQALPYSPGTLSSLARACKNKLTSCVILEAIIMMSRHFENLVRFLLQTFLLELLFLVLLKQWNL